MSCQNLLDNKSKFDIPSTPKKWVYAVKNQPIIVSEYVVKEFKRKNPSILALNTHKDVTLAFQFLIDYLRTSGYRYEPNRKERLFIMHEPHGKALAVNCFDLAIAMKYLARALGVPDRMATTHIYKRTMLSKPLGKDDSNKIQGDFLCFDDKERYVYEKTGGLFLFKQHCVAKIYNRYYDLTFMCHYDEELAIFDQSPLALMSNAICEDELSKLQNLIKCHPNEDLNARLFAGETLLINAARHGYDEMVSLLLEKKVDVEIRDNYGLCAIQYISDINSRSFELLSHRSKLDLVDECIEKFQKIQFIKGRRLIRDGKYQGIHDLLIQHRFLISKMDEVGRTLLHWAAVFRRPEIAKLLLLNGAKVTQACSPDKDGYPIDYIPKQEQPQWQFLCLRSEKKTSTELTATITPYYKKQKHKKKLNDTTLKQNFSFQSLSQNTQHDTPDDPCFGNGFKKNI